MFEGGNIVEAMEAVIKRFTGKKAAPKDDAALNVLTQAMTKVAELRRIVPISAIIAATPASAQVHKNEAPQVAVDADFTCVVEPLAATEAKVA